jgi:DNA-binding transcriptional ArsR family regulator
MTPDVFDALANPIRRELLARLRSGPQPVKALADGFARGRPAISEHLDVLLDAGLVRREPRGRERWYHLDARPLREVADWLAAYERFWADKLSDLATLLDGDAP